MTADLSPGDPKALVTLPVAVYDALLDLAAAHKRERCTCENCPPGEGFPYDACECGEDWSSCADEVALVEQWTPRPWGWRDEVNQ